MDFLLSAFGFIGGVLVLSAYVPQITKLVRVRTSTGISLTTWSIWFLGAVLFLIYAIHTGDPIFILIDLLELIAITAVLVLAWRYRASGKRRKKLQQQRTLAYGHGSGHDR